MYYNNINTTSLVYMNIVQCPYRRYNTHKISYIIILLYSLGDDPSYFVVEYNILSSAEQNLISNEN